MKIALYAHPKVYGGLMRHVEHLAEKLLNQHQISLILPEIIERVIFSRKDSSRELGLSFDVVRGKWDWIGCFRLYHFLRKTRPDIFHLHLASPGESTLPILASYLARIPVTITTEHSPSYFPRKKFYSRKVKRFCQKFIDLTIALSRSGQQFLIQQYGIDPGKVRIVPNGVELPESLSEGEKRIIRNKLGVRGDALLITTISEVTERKGISLLLQAAQELIEKETSLHFLIIGEGPLKGELQDHYRPYVLSNHISFLGHQEDVMPFLSISDLFVLPSLGEEMPLSVMEAMAAGVPVIATAVGGIPEIIEHAENGWLVQPGDAHELTRALTRLIEEKERACALAEKAFRMVQTRYSLSGMVSRTEEIYRSLLAEKRGSS